MSQQAYDPTRAWTEWQRSMERGWFRFPRGWEAPSARQLDEMHVDFWEEAIRQGLATMRQCASMAGQAGAGSGAAGGVAEDVVDAWLVGLETFWAHWFLGRRDLDLDWSNQQEAMAKLGELWRESARRAAQALG